MLALSRPVLICVFEVFGGVFCVFRERSDFSKVSIEAFEKKSVLDTERGHYCTLYCAIPPFYF